MSRWVPHPVLSGLLFVFWLLMGNTVEPAQILLALLVALLLPHLARGLRRRGARMRAPAVVLRLALRVAVDVVLSNLEVARLILSRRARIHSRFIRVPCALEDPTAVSILAGIITLTPGTLTVDISPDMRVLTIHCLHAPDPQGVIDAIRERYEQPLGEIFPCSTPRS